METTLTENLFRLVRLYAAKRGMEETTVGRLCAADGRFFGRLRERKTFTVKKYDEVVLWFSANWPDGVEWPTAIERPVAAEPEHSEAAA